MAKKLMSKLRSFARCGGASGGAGNVRTSPRSSFPYRLMNENIASAEAVITRWDSDSSGDKLTSLFSGDSAEASLFLQAISNLQIAMLFFSSPNCPDPPAETTLVRAQSLMQSAMRRLEKEFFRILSSNGHRLDTDSFSSSSSSSSDDDEALTSVLGSKKLRKSSPDAIADLRSIADAMISNGYGRECVRAYKLLRKSNIEEGLFRLGFDIRLPTSNIPKLDWPVLEPRIRSWLSAARSAIPGLFVSERLLCGILFFNSDDDAYSEGFTESCFADVALDVVLRFLAFPESVAKTKRSPEKLFRILDLYEALSNLWPQIQTTFSYQSMASVESTALNALEAIGAAARDTIAEFEITIQKEASKSPVPGGDVHPLTRYAMDYLVCIADYAPVLAGVYVGIPFRPAEQLPDSSEPCSSMLVPAGVSERVAWLLLLLLCKLDVTAELYREVSLSYLFLANNLRYVVNQVRGSRLRILLGDRWVERHQETARRYAESYVRLRWGDAAARAEWMLAFDEAAWVQEERVDDWMSEEKMEHGCPTAAAAAAPFSPENVRGWLTRMFSGSECSESAGSSRRSFTKF